MNKIIKKITAITITGVVMASVAVTAFATSESINDGGATWSGGVNSSNIVYSQLVDNKVDGLKYKTKVWVINDLGQVNEKTDTTSAKGKAGRVYTSIGASYWNPFGANKSGYDYITVLRT